MKFLLSSGRVTDKVEEYLIDLFKLYLTIYPGDIPGASEFGFDFNLIGVYKDALPGEIQSRALGLVNKVNSRFKSGVSLSLKSLEMIDETRVRMVVSAGEKDEEITVDIY